VRRLSLEATTTKEPTMPAKLRYLLTSRKFWAAAASLIILIAGERAGIGGEDLALAIATLAAYIIGTALEDGLSRRK
jgi:hypothetical protein